MAASTAVCGIALLLGVALLVGTRSSSMAVSGVAFKKPFMPQIPGVFIGPHRAFLSQVNGTLTPIGFLLLLGGLIGLGVVLWIWKPWSSRRRGGASDRDIGMPSYL
jgi:hypothetical protein